MADAMCGSSNALQQFKQHTSVDRTLQNDRLQSRSSPSQGFRSPQSNPGLLDTEFEAFHSGFDSGPIFEPAHFQPFTPYNAPHSLQKTPQAAPDWAADFQRMHLSEMTSPNLQDFRMRPTLRTSTPGGWHQDFQSLNAQAVPARNTQSLLTPAQRFGGMGVNNGISPAGHSMYGAISSVMPPESMQQVVDAQMSEEVFDEAAFDQAFEQAAAAAAAAAEAEAEAEARASLHDERVRQAEIQRQSAASWQAVAEDVQSYEQSLDALPEQMMQDYLEDLERVGADTIEDVSRATQADQTTLDDRDELARTAGALLDRVKGNQSEKFQQSSFLALMRQLRDKEVVVEGDDIVRVSHTHRRSSRVSTELKDHKQESQARPPRDPISGVDPPLLDDTMTGAINADDIGKFDDMASCALSSGGLATLSDERVGHGMMA